ncbi:hypothetical protein D3C81_1445900 [compost metagenome]
MFKGSHEGGFAWNDVGPRLCDDDEKRRQHEEHQDSHHHGIDGLADVARRVFGLGRGERGHFHAGHREDDHHDPGEQGPYAVGEETAMIRKVAETSCRARPKIENIGTRHCQEHHNGHDLDAGEPVFGFPERVHRHQIQQGHANHQTKGNHPDRQVREPAIDDLPADNGLEANDDDPEIPVQPTRHVARRSTKSHTSVVNERAFRWMRSSHFTEHAHHEGNDQTGDGISDKSARPR